MRATGVYRIELQLPYGTLRAAHETTSVRDAYRAFRQYLRASRGKGFVPCLLHGLEISPDDLRLLASVQRGRTLLSW